MTRLNCFCCNEHYFPSHLSLTEATHVEFIHLSGGLDLPHSHVQSVPTSAVPLVLCTECSRERGGETGSRVQWVQWGMPQRMACVFIRRGCISKQNPLLWVDHMLLLFWGRHCPVVQEALFSENLSSWCLVHGSSTHQNAFTNILAMTWWCCHGNCYYCPFWMLAQVKIIACVGVSKVQIANMSVLLWICLDIFTSRHDVRNVYHSSTLSWRKFLTNMFLLLCLLQGDKSISGGALHRPQFLKSQGDPSATGDDV